MVAEWKKKTKGGMGAMVDPGEHADSVDMFKNNRGWPPDNVKTLAGPTYWKWNMHPTPALNYAAFQSLLNNKGPLWAAGTKKWAGGPHNHVVVICGVADTGLFVHDPEPIGSGSVHWLTWKQMGEYFKGDGSIDCNIMTAM
jgi:hypothetical protein